MIRASTAYDLSIPYQEYGHSEPNAQWPVAALIRCVELLIMQPPWKTGGLRRSIWITSALARLGEKGIPADAVLRTCIGPKLKQRLAVLIATAWHSSQVREVSRASLPSNLRDWLDKFDDLAGLKEQEEYRLPPLEEVMVLAQTGAFGRCLDAWISSTATAHVVDWRVSNAMTTEVFPADTVLRGGSDATHWIFDRYSETYLTDWRTESLAWELSYARSPELTAARAGVDRAIVDERPTSTSLVLEAVVTKHTHSRHGVTQQSYGGVELGDLVHQIVHLTTSGDVQQALDLAKSAAEKSPHEPVLRNIFAFTQIPFEPNRARRLLEGLNENQFLNTLNVLSCYLAAGDLDKAIKLLDVILSESNISIEVWLWCPNFLLKRKSLHVVQFVKSEQWLNQVRDTIFQLTVGSDNSKKVDEPLVLES